jgi:hypothetical protein
MPFKEKLKNTLIWGFLLWLFGYLAGIVLFFVVPKNSIGLVITPFATILTVWVLLKKIKRPALTCYFGTGVVWTIMAVLLDYVFLVKAFKTESTYYKPDVFLYYLLTFTLPILVGYWKFKHKPPNAELF